MLGKSRSEHPLERAAREAGTSPAQLYADMDAGIAQVTNVRGRFNTMTARQVADYRAVVNQRRQQAQRQQQDQERKADQERRQAEAADLLARAQRLVGGTG